MLVNHVRLDCTEGLQQGLQLFLGDALFEGDAFQFQPVQELEKGLGEVGKFGDINSLAIDDQGLLYPEERQELIVGQERVDNILKLSVGSHDSFASRRVQFHIAHDQEHGTKHGGDEGKAILIQRAGLRRCLSSSLASIVYRFCSVK